jgi:hypothetical protein
VTVLWTAQHGVLHNVTCARPPVGLIVSHRRLINLPVASMDGPEMTVKFRRQNYINGRERNQIRPYSCRFDALMTF